MDVAAHPVWPATALGGFCIFAPWISHSGTWAGVSLERHLRTPSSASLGIGG